MFVQNFLNATGERPPYQLLGWGGGCTAIVEYARAAPLGRVSSLVCMDGYPNNVEFREKQVRERERANERSENVDIVYVERIGSSARR